MNVYKYLYRNPVEAGLCKRVQDYKYSTLYGIMGESRLIIPIEEDSIMSLEELNEILIWLNTEPSEKNKEDLRYLLDVAAAFYFFKNQLFSFDGIFRINREKGLLFTTNFFFHKPS